MSFSTHSRETILLAAQKVIDQKEKNKEMTKEEKEKCIQQRKALEEAKREGLRGLVDPHTLIHRRIIPCADVQDDMGPHSVLAFLLTTRPFADGNEPIVSFRGTFHEDDRKCSGPPVLFQDAGEEAPLCVESGPLSMKRVDEETCRKWIRDHVPKGVPSLMEGGDLMESIQERLNSIVMYQVELPDEFFVGKESRFSVPLGVIHDLIYYPYELERNPNAETIAEYLVGKGEWRMNGKYLDSLFEELRLTTTFHFSSDGKEQLREASSLSGLLFGKAAEEETLVLASGLSL